MAFQIFRICVSTSRWGILGGGEIDKNMQNPEVLKINLIREIKFFGKIEGNCSLIIEKRELISANLLIKKILNKRNATAFQIFKDFLSSPDRGLLRLRELLKSTNVKVFRRNGILKGNLLKIKGNRSFSMKRKGRELWSIG